MFNPPIGPHDHQIEDPDTGKKFWVSYLVYSARRFLNHAARHPALLEKTLAKYPERDQGEIRADLVAMSGVTEETIAAAKKVVWEYGDLFPEELFSGSPS